MNILKKIFIWSGGALLVLGLCGCVAVLAGAAGGAGTAAWLSGKLVQQVDRKLIVSGIGEQPAIIHLRDFKLGGFTSGCVCVAPKLSRLMLEALR